MLHKLALAALGSLILAPLGNAQDVYYTIDVAHDALCAINVDTGVADPLGPLQVHLDNVDLAWHVGALYAKTYGGSAGSRVCQIVTEGEWIGFALQGAGLNGGGYANGEAAGLASDGNRLYLTYTTSNPNDSYSGSFGIVEPIWAGSITSAAPTIGNHHDIDAMGFAWGEFWGIDVIAPGSGYELFHGDVTVGPKNYVGGESLYDPATNPTDLEYYNDQWLIAVSQDGHNLVQINRTNGHRGIITAVTGLQPGGVLKGIARRPDPCSPFRIGHWH